MQLLFFSGGVTLILGGVVEAGYVEFVDETFTGETAPGWVFVNGQGDGPSLTGSPGGPDHNIRPGWLRLTEDRTNQSSLVYYDTPIPTNSGLVFEFEFVIWSTNASVGDGFALVVFDANVEQPAAGGYGGSLGYAQRYRSTPGLPGGILGIGFDEFGNFSNPGSNPDNPEREGGPGRRQNSVAVRGSQGDTRFDGYAYQVGTGDGDDWKQLAAFAKPNAASRDQATVHAVRITIPTTRVVTVEWSQGAGQWETLIEYLCTLTCPEEVKFGFTAGTGSVTAHHEIRNLQVSNAQAIPEPGSISLALGAAMIAVGASWRWRLLARQRCTLCSTSPQRMLAG